MSDDVEQSVGRLLGQDAAGGFGYRRFDAPLAKAPAVSAVADGKPAASSAAGLFSLLGDALPEAAEVAVDKLDGPSLPAAGGGGATPGLVAQPPEPSPAVIPPPPAAPSTFQGLAAPGLATTALAPAGAAAAPSMPAQAASLFPSRAARMAAAPGGSRSIREVFELLGAHPAGDGPGGGGASFPFRHGR